MVAMDIPQHEPERREWIKYRLKVRTGLSLRRLAAKLDVAPSTVKMALFRRYPRIEKEIAKRLGLTPQALWPDRYDAKGKPIRLPMGRPPKKGRDHGRPNTTPSTARHAYPKGAA